jgi:antitoxin component YwqK of YwqJK toxin-antitoxin module
LISGFKEGHWTEWYENNRKSFEGNYLKNKRDGKGLEYDENGGIVWDGEYKEGLYSGYGKLLNNNKLYTGNWIQGKKNGNFIIEYNQVKAEGKYIDDLKNGIWTVLYSNGKKMSETEYTNDEIVNGSYTEWYDNGQIKESKIYQNSKLNGIHSKWFSNGNSEIVLNYKNGEIVNGQYFYYDKDGNILKECNYNNGILISEYLCAGKTRNGDFTEYYNDGTKKMTGKYVNGTRNVYQKYGAILIAQQKTQKFFKGLGSLVLTIVVLYVCFVSGTLK